MTGRASRTLLAAFLPLLLTGALACRQREEKHVEVSEGTPVVLISIDTLRADRLPAYGYGKVETPTLTSLEDDAIVFDRAYSHIPFTLPSHTSILTGLKPTEHGLRDNLGYKLEPDKVPFMPRMFHEMGYATGGAVSAYVLNANTGIGIGWDFYDDQVQLLAGRDLGGLQRMGDETLRIAVDWLDSVKDRPFFLFFHIYEPHTPHEAPEPFASRFEDPYDAEVATADHIIGELFDALRARGLYDRSLIILLSDHGEGLMDHGDPEHSLFVYREVLQVPLMLKLPNQQRAGTRVQTPVQLTDVFPTLFDLFNRQAPDELAGSSLLSVDGMAADSRNIYSENYYPRLHFGWSELASLIEWPYHLISSPDPELYNLAEDPAETNNILLENRRVYGRLKQILEGMETELEGPQEFDPENQERLAALGYIGGAGLGLSEGPRADPKSKLDVFTNLREAFGSFANNDFDEAAQEFEKLLESEPEMIAAWRYYARSLKRLGRQEEAVAAYKKAFELSNGAPEVARGAAELLLQMNRLDEAKAYAEIALPVFDSANDILAMVALRQKNIEEADTYSQQALEHRGSSLAPLIIRAEVELELGQPEVALELTDKAIEEFGDRKDFETLRGLYLSRGRAYGELGDAEAAIQAFRREIELDPSEIPPYTHLALMYALLDEGPKAGLTLQKLVEGYPSPESYAAAVRTLRLMGDERSAAMVLRDARRRWPKSDELRELES